jgi:hypothetical protein
MISGTSGLFFAASNSRGVPLITRRRFMRSRALRRAALRPGRPGAVTSPPARRAAAAAYSEASQNGQRGSAIFSRARSSFHRPYFG